MHRRLFLTRSARTAAAFGVLRYLPACAGSTPHATAGGSSTFARLRDRYFIQTLQFNPVTSTYLGGDGYSPALAGVNGRLRDYRPEALAAEREFYLSVQRQLQQIARADLPASERIDYDVLGAQLAFLLHQSGDLRYYERAVDTYVAEPFRGVDWQIQQMQDTGDGRLGSEAEWSLLVSRVGLIPAYLDTARGNLLAGRRNGNTPDRRMVRRDGIEGGTANADYFHDTLPRLASGLIGDRRFAATTLDRVRRAGSAAADAYRGFGRFLAETYGASDRADHFAIGEAEYQWRLTRCLNVSRPVAELHDYGAEQVTSYTSQVFAVAQEVAHNAGLALPFGTDAEKRTSVRRVMDHLSKDSPADDDELFRWYRETGEYAVRYGRDRQLFDIPANYRLDVEPTPPVLRSTIDAAYYPAPPFKRSGIGRFYLTPTDNDAAALKLNNRASVATTAIHEGFPGHDWHFKYMTQHADEISNIRWLTPGSVEDSSSMWEDSMLTEGWALYSEELMADPSAGRPHGFYTAAEHLYELQAQLLRAVRVRVDVGMHTGRMAYDEAVDYFTEHVSFYPGACAAATRDGAARAVCDTASRAIYRYSKWPTQAITYNLGKNEILSLREAYRKQQGKTYSAQAFHERLMRMGTIPASYFRDAFLE